MIGEVELQAFCCVAGGVFGRQPTQKENPVYINIYTGIYLYCICYDPIPN